ncbi:MAG: histidinol-phosphate transaminase [Patescibacteria group bacterium]
MKINFSKLAKRSVQTSPAYSSARSLVAQDKGLRNKDKVFLDANENAFGSVIPKIAGVDLSRYPDPLAEKLRAQLAKFVGVAPKNILVGNGSDEIIWLLLLGFVEAQEEILTFAPTFSMYRVFAELLGLKVVEVPLAKNYSLDTQKFLAKISAKTKLIFLCSPNNPTGQTVPLAALEKILARGKITIVDEAYIDFAPGKSALRLLKKYPNLIILRTFSKAWGLAGLRVGFGVMRSEAVDILKKVRAPYSVDALSQKLAGDALKNSAKMQMTVKKILTERKKLIQNLTQLGIKIFPTDANFLLAQFPTKVSASKVQQTLLQKFGIVLRDFSKNANLQNCIRITVGSQKENEELLRALKSFKDLGAK